MTTTGSTSLSTASEEHVPEATVDISNDVVVFPDNKKKTRKRKAIAITIVSSMLVIAVLSIIILLVTSKSASKTGVSSSKATTSTQETLDMDTTVDFTTLLNRVTALENHNDQLKATSNYLINSIISNQLFSQRQTRGLGQSGVVDIRGRGQGIRPYSDGTFSRGAFNAIHNHANNLGIVGMGEIQAVLNGIQFQSRHNDYRLEMPSKYSKQYERTQKLPFPNVPWSVRKKKTIQEQINEMQEYFRAFKTQNISHRNYKPFFKPVLCYLEGVFVEAVEDITNNFDENIDRHFVDAKTFSELFSKIEYFENNGLKDRLENIPISPRIIRRFVTNKESGISLPVFADFKYRILCHPLKDDLPLSRLRIENDLLVQLYGIPKTRDELYYDRRARFELDLDFNKNNPNDINHDFSNSVDNYDYLDYLMNQIPGKDNYKANITNQVPGGYGLLKHPITKNILNVGYYNRYYNLPGNDAMGTTLQRRGWNDQFLFVAKTTQNKVSPVEYSYTKNGKTTKIYDRVSYAIPLEIIYLTPLQKWNPFNITYYSKQSQVIANNRNGRCDNTGKPYKGYSDRYGFFTPNAFYNSNENPTDPADTTRGAICTLDAKGIKRSVRASGTYITLPDIGNNVGKVRQRYPIAPIHFGGNTMWKEIKALSDIVLDFYTYDELGIGNRFFGIDREKNYGIKLQLFGGGHDHFIRINPTNLIKYWYNSDGSPKTDGTAIAYTASDTRNGHRHKIKITRSLIDGKWKYIVQQCIFFGQKYPLKSSPDYAATNGKCLDGHTMLDLA